MGQGSVTLLVMLHKYTLSTTLEERFWMKVEKTDTCWIWTGAKATNGYGRFKTPERVVQAHRFSYELVKGKIPEGLVMDHRCRVRACVNPAHLEAVTIWENNWRAMPYGLRMVPGTHCFKGHLLSEDNLYHGFNGDMPYRRCKKCTRETSNRLRRKYRAKQKADRIAASLPICGA